MKMILSILLLSRLLWSIAGNRFNLYNTDKNLDINNLQVNCLHYYSRFNGGAVEKIEYCLKSTDNNNLSNDDFLNIRDRNFTFDELRQLDVTTNDLLLWSATIDLAEQYQYYLDHQNESSISEEIFFNCTKPWFGPRCQYSFEFDEILSFQTIVRKTLKKKFDYDSPYSITNLTCYIHLKCDRGGSGMCLDWREVCDGRIDCIDGGADEAQCFDLEINECNENEYRCHNGLCIPKEFLDESKPQCLDKSDILDLSVVKDILILPITFDYEDYSCRPGHEQFACGDAQCVADFDTCKNKRHLLLIEFISAQGNLSYNCWISMICLTKILDRIDETSCNQLLSSSNISTYLQTCEDLIQFPTVPVLFGHVRFLYRLNNIRALNTNHSLTPDYICYDQRLCHFLTPTYFHQNYSCRYINEFDFDWSVKPKNWNSIIRLVEQYFRKCLTKYNNNKNDSHHPSLYCCKNSSKCISKYRILDGISDCYLNDDEKEFELSCSIHDILRFKCGNENKCYSSLVSRAECPPRQLRNFDEIEFPNICDRHIQMFPIISNGQNYTDETECEHWPCNNLYTRCDGFWSCSDGEDEENCTTQPICPSRTLPCVSSVNYTLTCLSANQVGNEYIDCLGAVDEFQHCRNYKTFDLHYPGFRCWNDEKCITTGLLCDGVVDCPFEDDETFCRYTQSHKSCVRLNAADRTNIDNAICLTSDLRENQFSLKTSPIYPLSETRTTIEHIAQRPIKRRQIVNFIANRPDDPAWPWRYNKGLYVRHWLGGNNFSYKCFCPPSYYGDKCQYQNQRVSFTAKVRLMNSHSVYAIIITLIDDNVDRQEIISYNQFTSATVENCEENFNAYLIYPTRPKDNSKNYSVRVDVFNKTFLRYLASWHFTIPFSFLPVNRMAVIVHVPIEQIPSPTNCPLICHNDECMKYINKEKFFCQCHTNWSGARCDIPIRCSDCSSDSICIGMIHNRSICVCPLHKGGPRCLLTLLCPSEELCFNNSTCLVTDDGMNELGFACRCSKQFRQPFCDEPTNKLEISFHNIKMSSFVLIYTFELDYREVIKKMVTRVIVQKLTIFQRTVLVYLAYKSDMVFVRIDKNYYLAVLQQIEPINISISISPAQQCLPITELLNTKQVVLPIIRRMKHYHVLCQTHLDLMCFVDEPYMCICTLERHANCFKFNDTSPKCPYNFHCQHGGECLQDEHKCPYTAFCNCTDCFFGDRCELYAKGIGLILDDILRYEIRPNTTIYDQTSVVKWSSALTMIMFVAGLINSILSIITFRTKQSRQAGCGLYLLASSITSLLTINIFTIKFWFLILTQINPSVSRSVLQRGCIAFEYIIKVCLYMDNWLNACVAFERLMTVYKGINFNQILSKRLARWIIIFLLLFIMISFIHELMYRDLFDDIEEQRLWCALHYSSSIQNYNAIILFFHNIGPFCINFFSAFFIIFRSARRRAATQQRQTYKQHLRQQLQEHKNLIISPIILVILMIPRLLISFTSGCVKVSHNSWLYLFGYFVSFIPSMSIFFVFVLPSEFYRNQFKDSIKSCRR